jgi:pimeloyl-ACP methyl ester carboxylesterase
MAPNAPPTSKIHLCTPPEPGKKAAKTTYIIYFLTGNPGLVEYYRAFLTHLYGVLTRDTASNRDVEFHVYGRSYSGFEMRVQDIKTYKYRKIPPYGLQDQIRHAEDDVVELVEEVKDQGGRDVRVILVGHSVGSYIGLEIVRRLRAHGLAGEDFDTRISGVVGLFPTVVDIARSESGVKLAVRFPFPLSPIISDLVGMMRFANSRDSPFSKTQTSHSSCRYLQASSAC